MNLEALNNVIWYDKVATVARLRSVVAADGSTEQEASVVLEAVPCRLSLSSADEAAGAAEINQVSQALTLFCAPAWEIRAGDKVVVDGVEYAAGAPYAYPGHQQIPLSRETEA